MGSSEARIVLAARGSGSTRMHLTATNDATSERVADKSVDVVAGAPVMIDLALQPASYTVHVDAFADAAATKPLGSGEAHATLAADTATEIHLTASSDASSGSSAGVIVNVNGAPKIEGIQVTQSATSAQIHVDATDPEGGSLSFFWSGLGLAAATQGSATLTITAEEAAKLSADPAVHVVVQDSDGATAAATIDFTGGSCLVCGGSSTTVDGAGGEASAEVQACLQARAGCNVTCDAKLQADPLGLATHVACLSACGLDLASCEAKAH